jgi:hypothetical protein
MLETDADLITKIEALLAEALAVQHEQTVDLCRRALGDPPDAAAFDQAVQMIRHGAPWHVATG